MSFLDDAEGHALVQAIHDRKAQTEGQDMTNHEAIVKAQLERAYGVSYAKAYALCRDAGMGKEDAETAISHLVQDLSMGRSVGADQQRVHTILSQAGAAGLPPVEVSGR